MGSRFIPKSSSQFKEEQRLRKIMQGVVISKTDTTKIEQLYAKFREVCNTIKDLMHYDEFRGTYDEILNLPVHLSDRMDSLILKWQILDSAIKVEATKLGYKGDQWIRNCWGTK